MSKRIRCLLVFGCVLGVLALIGCGQSAAEPTEAPVAEEQPPDEVAAEEEEAATDEPTEATTEAPTPEEAPTEEPTAAPLNGTSSNPGRIAPEGDKPALPFVTANGDSEAASALIDELLLPVDHVIGFAFPDGTIAMRAAALPESMGNNFAEGLDTIGVVQIGEGEGGAPPGMYALSLDLQSDSNEVEGVLSPLEEGDEQGLLFNRSKLEINEERGEVEAPIQVSMSSSTICYDIQVGEAYWQYCSSPNSILNVAANFGEQYGALTVEMEEATFALVDAGFLTEQQASNIEISWAIAEMEDPGSIVECDGQACGADIGGSPNLGFPDEYAAMVEGDVMAPFKIPAGVVRVYQPVAQPFTDVLPGDYVVEYWFNEAYEFDGATVSGITLEGGDQVVNQPITTASAQFLNVDNPEQTDNRISAWRLMRWCCFWQSNCP